MATAEIEPEVMTPEELSQAGAFEDDAEDLAALRAAIYRDRGRSEAEEVGRRTSPQTADKRPWISNRKEE